MIQQNGFHEIPSLFCILILSLPNLIVSSFCVFQLVWSTSFLSSLLSDPIIWLVSVSRPRGVVCSLTSLQPSKPFSRTYLRRKIERITAVLVYFDIFAIQTHLFCADPLLMNGPQTTNKSRGLDFHTSDHQSNTFSTLARQQCCCHTLLQSVLTQQ